LNKAREVLVVPVLRGVVPMIVIVLTVVSLLRTSRYILIIIVRTI